MTPAPVISRAPQRAAADGVQGSLGLPESVSRSRSSTVPVGVLLVPCTTAWVVLAHWAASMSGDTAPMGLGLWRFMGTWVVMMAAMMLPLLLVVRFNGSGLVDRGVATAAFAAIYFSVWVVVGFLSYPANEAFSSLVGSASFLRGRPQRWTLRRFRPLSVPGLEVEAPQKIPPRVSAFVAVHSTPRACSAVRSRLRRRLVPRHEPAPRPRSDEPCRHGRDQCRTPPGTPDPEPRSQRFSPSSSSCLRQFVALPSWLRPSALRRPYGFHERPGTYAVKGSRPCRAVPAKGDRRSARTDERPTPDPSREVHANDAAASCFTR